MKIGMLKKSVAALLTAVMLTTSAGFLPKAMAQEGNAYWPSFRRDTANNAIVNELTARNSDEVQVKWAKNFAGTSWWVSMGSPIIVGDHIYVAVNDKIKKLDKNTGEELAEGTMIGSVGFFSFVTYGEGKLFVPVGSRVQAFDAETLTSLWVTEESQYQALAPVIYDEGRVYTGMSTGNGSKGEFFCVDATDEDPMKTDEVKATVWKDEVPCYWAGAAIVDDAVVYGNDNGLLQSRNKVDGTLIDTFTADSNIRCSIAYDETSGDIFFTAKDAAKVYGISMEEDGSFDDASVRSGEVYGLTTTTPVVYNGRVYVTSGSMDDTTKNSITVLKADNLEKIYDAELGGICQSSPLLTTGYASEGNKNTVYLYSVLNTNTSEVKVIRDYEGNTTPDVQTLYIPEQSLQQYSTHSLISDGEGTIIHKNDGGNLMALSCTPSEQLNAVDQVTEKIAALGEIKDLSQKEAVMAARAAFDALSEEQKALVVNQEVLNAAELKISELEVAAKEDQAAAQSVIDQINGLGKITGLNQKQAVQAARDAYNKLTDAQKAYVSEDVLKLLTAAEAEITKLEQGSSEQNQTEVSQGKTQKTNVKTGISENTAVMGSVAVLVALAGLGAVGWVRFRRK